MTRKQNMRDALAQKLATMDTCVCSMRLFTDALEKALTHLQAVNKKKHSLTRCTCRILLPK